ncbi:hypothetical protein [Phytopseudomonas daroniae]|nr:MULTISPECIES: hypothetical protein [Pseudomonas]
MDFLLGEWGYQIENMGPNTPVGDVVNWLKSNPCEMVVVSTVNGHGYIEGIEIARRVRGDAKFHGLLCVGGKICTENDPLTIARHSEALKEAGFDGVFDDSVKNSFDYFQALVMETVEGGRSGVPNIRI